MADITVSNLWDLQADPGQLEADAITWQGRVTDLQTAQDLIDAAADRVVDGEYWTGSTADAFTVHREKLTADLGAAAALAGEVVTALNTCADVLRYNQGLLTQERCRLEGIAVTRSGGQWTFHPADEAQETLVHNVITAANEIRRRVDEQLTPPKTVLADALPTLQDQRDRWTARTLRMLNFNIQEGGEGNKAAPWDRGDHGYQGRMDELAQRIVDGDVDVATLQEIFRVDAEQLEEELNALAGDGERWEVHFGQASEKWRGSGYIPGKEDFGNVVVVRTHDGLQTTGEQNTVIGDGDGGRAAIEVNMELG
ncbi:hypothetical protein [Rhizocola hellebori]|nr:hypothetical protein [Rhizocola hellebori]